ncbi:MAG: type II toxin-antitoxin system RelE/ParE family toxin [Candidatus Paracaedibacteraceae bacterium]|nr:type II toxin-antitoxin system RelE/ParE family toxin [Candidatus Paracaedibacteraceae bacterium]
MRYLKVNKSSLKIIETLQNKHRDQIVAKINSLKDDPFPVDSKKLSGYSPYLRCDCGEYRIIYSVNEALIEIFLVGKRNDDEVYSKFKRRYKNN